MDTRSKIVPVEEVREQFRSKDACWLTGHFDPLLAEHVRSLREHKTAGRPLIVEVTNPPKPLLHQRARAELVAALAEVDYVVLGNGTAGSPAIDESITERFIKNVLTRYRAEGAG